MISSPQLVIAWFEYAVGATILLAATKLIVVRLRQPVDRVNLIALSLAVTAFVPLLLVISNGPSFRLGVISSSVEQGTHFETKQGAPLAQHDLGTPQTLEIPAESLIERIESQPVVNSSSQAETTVLTTETPSTLSALPARALSTAGGNPSNAWSLAAAILIIGHVLAIAWFLVQWTFGTIRLHNISRRATTADDYLRNAWKQVSGGHGGSVTLQVTTEIAAPMVCGWIRPTVLVPRSVATGDLETLRFCLAHEWSHIRCNDLAKWKLSNWCQLLLWYQPLEWVLQRELRVCQDLIADDFAAGTSNEQLGRIQYSELLISIAKQSMSHRIAGTLAFHERSSQLSRRIKALLTNTQSLNPRSTRSFLYLWSALFLTVSMLVGSVRLSTVEAQEVPAIKPTNEPAVEQTAQANQPQKEQPAQADAIRTVRGRVVSAAGEPVPGAKLWLPLQFKPRRTAEATADLSGNFELKFPVDWISPTIMGRLGTVWAYAPGHSIQTQSVFEAIAGDNTKEYTLQLPPPSDTTFQVLEPNGKPLSDVLVKPQYYKTSVAFDIVPEKMQSELSVRTDVNGWVKLPAVESGLLFSLELFHEQFGRQSIRLDYPMVSLDDLKAGITREIQLRPVASIHGRLVGDRQEWTRNVKLGFVTEPFNEGNVPHGIAEIVTDDRGHFEIPKMAIGGRLRGHVELDPKLPVRPLLSENVFLSEGETRELEIPLVDAPLVHGKVVERSTGKPVAKAEVLLVYGSFLQRDYVTSDENGRYEGRVLPGPVRVQVLAVPDGSVQVGMIGAKTEVPADVKEYELPTIEVVGLQEIVGELVDSDNLPLPNLLVQVADTNDHRQYGTTKSNERGQFEIRVPIGVATEFFVTVENRGTIPAQVLKRDPLRVRVKLKIAEMKQ